MKKIVGLLVFFALCLGAFHFHENHESTGYKDRIAELEDKVKYLRAEHSDLNQSKIYVEGVNKQMRLNIETLAVALDELNYEWEEGEREHVDQWIGEPDKVKEVSGIGAQS